MLPHVDAFLPAHNIDSLVELARALSVEPSSTEHDMNRRAVWK